MTLSARSRNAEWSDLMRAAIAGDDGAYQRLLVDLSRALRPTVRRSSGVNGGDVEDVVQEVILAVHLKRHTWDQTKPIGPWIMAIARNKMIDEMRRRGRRGEVTIDDMFDLSDDASGAEDAVHAYDLNRVLTHLNDRARDIVTAIALEGQTSKDVADRLGMTEVAVRVTLHRSLKALSARYQEKQT
ncbi:MAG: sigma-70 family RNA polymerase sigma factor [Hyphomicrobium sp.]